MNIDKETSSGMPRWAKVLLVAGIAVVIGGVVALVACSPEGTSTTVQGEGYCIMADVVDRSTAQLVKAKAEPGGAYANSLAIGRQIDPCILSIRPNVPGEIDRDDDYESHLKNPDDVAAVAGAASQMSDNVARNTVEQVSVLSLVYVIGSNAVYAFDVPNDTRPQLAGLVVEAADTKKIGDKKHRGLTVKSGLGTKAKKPPTMSPTVTTTTTPSRATTTNGGAATTTGSKSSTSSSSKTASVTSSRRLTPSSTR